VKHPIQRTYRGRRNPLAHSVSSVLTGSVLLLAGAFASSSAMAQDSGATNLDRITVTGSNIPRTNTETPLRCRW